MKVTGTIKPWTDREGNTQYELELEIEFPEWFEIEIKQIREYISNLAILASKK